MPTRFAVLLLVFLAACGSSIFPMPGIRLLTVEYRQGEEVVLTTYYEDPDARRAADVWDYLATTPVMAGDAAETLAQSTELSTDLKGDIVISISHGSGPTLRETKAAGLTLVRDSADDHRWHLREADHDRLRPR